MTSNSRRCEDTCSYKPNCPSAQTAGFSKHCQTARYALTPVATNPPVHQHKQQTLEDNVKEQVMHWHLYLNKPTCPWGSASEFGKKCEQVMHRHLYCNKPTCPSTPAAKFGRQCQRAGLGGGNQWWETEGGIWKTDTPDVHLGATVMLRKSLTFHKGLCKK